jgi:hypothetical protein
MMDAKMSWAPLPLLVGATLYFGYQLFVAITRGTIRGRRGLLITKAERPRSFRINLIVLAISVVFFACATAWMTLRLANVVTP